MKKGIRVDENVYEDGFERRTLDLRPDGIECVPIFSQCRLQSVRLDTREHVHPGFIEICLCVRGRLFFETGGKEYAYFPGMVFVAQSHRPHRIRNNPKGLHLMGFRFAVPKGKTAVLGLSRAETRWLVDQMKSIVDRPFPATERVRCAFERVFELYDAEPPGMSRRLKLKSVLLELLLALVDASHAASTSREKANPRIEAIVSRMRAHPEADYPLAALASEAALSSVAFTSAFKRPTGLPPHAFLVDQRVRAAERDLARASEPVAAVARRYGFSSPQHLATAFRQVLGRSPRSGV